MRLPMRLLELRSLVNKAPYDGKLWARARARAEGAIGSAPADAAAGAVRNRLTARGRVQATALNARDAALSTALCEWGSMRKESLYPQC